MAYFLDPIGFRLPDPERFGFAEDANVRVIVGTDGDDTFRFTSKTTNPLIVIGLGGADDFITAAKPANTDGRHADENRYYGYGPQKENALDLLGDDFRWRPERDEPSDMDFGAGAHVKFGPAGGVAQAHGKLWGEGNEASIFLGFNIMLIIPDRLYAEDNFKLGRVERDPDGSGYRAPLIYAEFETGTGKSIASGRQEFLFRGSPNPEHGPGWEQEYVHSADRTFDRQDMQDYIRNYNGDGADFIYG